MLVSYKVLKYLINMMDIMFNWGTINTKRKVYRRAVGNKNLEEKVYIYLNITYIFIHFVSFSFFTF